MVIRSAPVAQCITDEAWRILAADDAYLAVLARPRSAILGRSVLDFTAPADQAVNSALLEQLNREGRGFTITKRYIRGDGALQWVSNHVSSFRDGEGPSRILATCEPHPADSVGHARRNALKLARLFDAAKQAFGDDLIGSPALEALLHLHLAEMEGRSLTPRCLATLIGQSQTATLRWLKVLEQRQLAEVERDVPLDLVAPMRITGAAQRRMEDVVDVRPSHPD